VLIDHLRTIQNDEQFQAQVESAIAVENQALLGERSAMAKQVEELRSGKDRAEKELEEQKQAAKAEVTKAQEALHEREKEAELMAISKRDTETKAKEISAKLSGFEAEKISTEDAMKQEVDRRIKAENQALRTAKTSSIIMAFLISLAFEFVIHTVWQWNWLLNHPNSYGLQGCICLMVSSSILGLWVKPWRKALWGVLLGALLVAMQILGGPIKTT
jgi:cation transport ATPase